MERVAYVTFVMRGDEYIKSAIVLAKSLKATGTTHPFFVMHTNDISDNGKLDLGKFFDGIIEIPYLQISCRKMSTLRMQEIYQSWIEYSFTKLNVFNPTYWPNVDKIIYLDADHVVLKNIDRLQFLHTPALGYDSYFKPLKGDKQNAKTKTLADTYALNLGDPISSKILNEIMSTNGRVGQTGTMVIKPSKEIFDAVLNLLNHYTINKIPYGYSNHNGFEEQLLAEVLIRQNITSYHITSNFYYNMSDFQAPIHVLNFYGSEKPWHATKNEYIDTFIWRYFDEQKK